MLKRLFYRTYSEASKHGLVPATLRKWAGRHVDLIGQRGKKWIEEDPYRFDPPDWKGQGRYPCVIGIFTELWHQHWPVVAACRDLGVSYRLLDITGPNWLEVVEQSGCDAFVARPSVQLDVWRQMYDERFYVISKVLHKNIFPTFEELWFYESKRRMCYWLEANRIPHPDTWVFYDRQQALDFAAHVDLPIVYKSNLGSGASGVIVFRDRNRLKKHIKTCFDKGFTTYRRSPHDREWRYALLQKYLPNSKEWRMVAVGDSYFGYEKLKRGEYHSGSLLRAYSRPCDDLLFFTQRVMETGGFTSMALDIFETEDGRYLVNELQAMWGMSRPVMCVVNGEAGRMVLQLDSHSWVFEKGDFCRNHLCNLRVQTLLGLLKKGDLPFAPRNETLFGGIPLAAQQPQNG